VDNPSTHLDDIPCIGSYWAEMDASDITPETMTDAGLPVSELIPVHDACLTPGHPSPVGRTPDGNLAYVEHAQEASIMLPRAHLGLLAYLVERHINDQSNIDPEIVQDLTPLRDQLLNTAVPEALFDQSAHGEIARKMVQEKTLMGNFGDLYDLTDYYD
jgi:hypothetical protein